MAVVAGVWVFLASLCAAVLNEFVTWILIYRTDDYKRLKGNLLRTERRLETGILLFLFYQGLTRMFMGQVVATLPFEPVPFFAKMTHRGLQGDNLTEGSVTFIYLLCSTCLRVIVAKVKNFGFTRSMDTSLSDNVWSKYVDTEEKTK